MQAGKANACQATDSRATNIRENAAVVAGATPETTKPKAAQKRRELKLVKTEATEQAVELTAATKAPEESVTELILTHRDNGRKLARSILRRWRVRMPADEIDSIVDLALCEAARRFSGDHGASFMTFLFYHLRGHLVRAVARAAQANNIFLAFAQSAGIDPGEWQHMSNEVIWTYAPDHMILGQKDSENPEVSILRKEEIAKCKEALSKLDELEREILARSFQDELPLVNIARSLGYSRCHISRVKKAALDRLKLILENSQGQNKVVETKPVERERPMERESFNARGRTKRRARRRSVTRVRVAQMYPGASKIA